MAKANVLEKYLGLTPEKRVDFICKNYSSFLKTIDSYTQGLVYMIEEELDYNRREARGDLGVRVSGGYGHSDSTANKAIQNVSLREAIINCDFTDGILDDTDNEEEIVRAASVLRKMRRDYDLFNSQLQLLSDEDYFAFRLFLSGERSLMEVADEWNIQYETAKKRVYRIRKQIKENVMNFTTVSYVG